MHETRVNHLNMIQGTINRLASQASSMKGFAFTAVGLITAIASQAKAPNLYLLAMAVAVLFMLLRTPEQ